MKNLKLERLDTLKEQVRGHLADYIARFRDVKPGKNFCCVNPSHPEKNPSCGIVPGNQELFHCFGCLSTGDIFVAAHMLEGKPLKGTGFLTDNLFHLAKTFGIDVPSMELSEEEQHDLDTYRAYGIAANILLTSKKADRVDSKLQNYGWSPKTLREMGVGSVTSYEDFIDQMTKNYGYDRQFLKNIDLDNKNIFNPNHLIFTVKDEWGQPVGFASRNLLYESLKEEYEQTCKEYGKDSQKAKEAKDKLPTKFVNTKQGDTDSLKNRIYRKGSRLYGFHVARKNAPPLFIFEGYGDGVTAHDRGLHNACAIGATAFTAEHLNMLLDLKIEHVIFVLDADAAGGKGTERFVKLVEEHLSNHVGLKVQIIIMPEGSDDPDAFIRAKGLEAFLELEKLDVFAWRLKQAVATGEDPDQIFEKTVGLIMNEPHNLKRLRMAESLSNATQIPTEVIWAEVQRRTDLDGKRISEEMGILADRTAKKLERNPDQIIQILSETQQSVDRISSLKRGYDLNNLCDYISGVLEEQETTLDEVGLKTGWTYFDTYFGGVPRKDVFITVPGKPNQGKTSSLINMAWRLAEFNDDAMVIFHTVDDAASMFIPRLFGSRYRISSNIFKAAGFHLANKTMVRPNGGDLVPFADVYAEAKNWLRQLTKQEKLLIYDASQLPGTFEDLELRVKDIRKVYPTSPMVVFGDNFHLYETQTRSREEAEEKVRNKSKMCKQLANVQHVALIMTMELPKSALEPGRRPRMANIKGTAGISYDSSANIGIYNDLKDMRDRAVLTWDEELSEPMEVAPGQVATRLRQPIIEAVFDKSKVNNGFDGEIYYYLHPASGQILECTPQDQEKYRAKALASQQQKPQEKGAKFSYDYQPTNVGAEIAQIQEQVDQVSEEDTALPFLL